MKVGLQPVLNDPNLDGAQPTSQRQLAISISAIPPGVNTELNSNLPLNLCLILDHSGSMKGRSIEMVKQAATRLVEQLSPRDRISIVVFDHRAKSLVPNQTMEGPLAPVKVQLNQLEAGGGTAIDEGLRLGIEELAKGKKETISQAFLLTDGENEHGDNNRCLKLAELAAGYNMTINSLGFGDRWNQDILEQIADMGGGTLSYIQSPDAAVNEFNRVFRRIQSVGLTNAYLQLQFSDQVRLADFKPLAQVSPETIELAPHLESGWYAIRLGDLMVDVPRVVLANLYLTGLPLGTHTIAQARIRYDDPSTGKTGLLSETIPVEATVQSVFQAAPNPEVQQHILALAKYRQTQIAETKLKQGDVKGAATMLQSAAKTALQMGDESGATVLQTSATRLQAGEELSDSDRKKTRIVSKTVLQ